MIRVPMGRDGVTDPACVANVGDTRADLEMGADAGCRLVIGVTTGAWPREELLRHPHTHVVGSAAEVPALVTG